MNNRRFSPLLLKLHQKKQRDSLALIWRICNALSEGQVIPISAEQSLRLQYDMYDALKVMRARQLLRCEHFMNIDEAIDVFHGYAEKIASKGLVEVYVGAEGSGFFEAHISKEGLAECLKEQLDGIAIVSSNLASGVLLDVVCDDPIAGNFFEVESWP